MAANNETYNEVRTDEQIQQIVEDLGTTVFVGRTRNFAATTADAAWEIKRILKGGGSSIQTYGNNADDNLIWDNRASYFAAPVFPFSNTLSTLLDGVNDYIDFGSASYTFDRLDDWSFSAWIYALDLTGQREIVSRNDNGTNGGKGYSIYVLGNQLYLELRFGAANRIHLNTTLAAIGINTWYHIVMTYDGSSLAAGVILYVNNTNMAITVGTNNLTNNFSDPNINAGIGVRSISSGKNNFWAGYIDEPSFWNRVLTAGEVSQIYNSGKPGNLATLSFYAAANAGWYRAGDNDTFPAWTDQKGIVPGVMVNFAGPSAFQMFTPS